MQQQDVKENGRSDSPGEEIETPEGFETKTGAHRLPVHHPEFRYTPSDNPYARKIQEIRGRAFADNDAESLAGRWKESFPDRLQDLRRELHVEIGCNGGHVILEWAARNPKAAYVGIDWKYKQVFRGAEKATKRKIDNLIFCRAYAERLATLFGPGEIDRLYLFFPDPWPKKSQWKNRFVQAGNLRRLAAAVKSGGIFHIKTDHDGYFDWMESAVAEVQDVWEVVEHTRDLHAGHPDPTQLTFPEVTLFERLFIKDGVKIKSMKLRKRA